MGRKEGGGSNEIETEKGAKGGRGKAGMEKGEKEGRVARRVIKIGE